MDSLLLTPESGDVSGGRGQGVSVGARGVAHMCLARWSGISTRSARYTPRTETSMWQVLTLGVGDGQGGLACCSPWGHKESDKTE